MVYLLLICSIVQAIYGRFFVWSLQNTDLSLQDNIIITINLSEFKRTTEKNNLRIIILLMFACFTDGVYYNYSIDRLGVCFYNKL